MHQLKFIGNRAYRGFDFDGKLVEAKTPGQIVSVTMDKALQLLKDFPTYFVPVDAKPEELPKIAQDAPKVEEPDQTTEQALKAPPAESSVEIQPSPKPKTKPKGKKRK